MPRPGPLCRLAALAAPLILAACDPIEDQGPGYVPPVTNASNGQPQPAASLPRGASSYGNPPNMMPVNGGVLGTYKSPF